VRKRKRIMNGIAANIAILILVVSLKHHICHAHLFALKKFSTPVACTGARADPEDPYFGYSP